MCAGSDSEGKTDPVWLPTEKIKEKKKFPVASSAL